MSDQHRDALAAHLSYVGEAMEAGMRESALEMDRQVREFSPVGETGDFLAAWEMDDLTARPRGAGGQFSIREQISGWNRDPAGQALERGSSDQAPAGILGPALAATRARFA